MRTPVPPRRRRGGRRVVPTTTPPDTAEATTPVSADPAAVEFCDASLAFDQALGALVEFTPSELETTVPLLDAAVAAGPDELTDQLGVISEALAASTSGDYRGFESPEFGEASDEIHAYHLAHCGWPAVEVSMVDFAFEGDRPTAPGVYSFDVTNDGEEPHLFIVARVRDDIEGSAAEVFEAATEETFDDSFETLSQLMIEPGGFDYQYLDLPEGRYLVFCPVPVGSTMETDGTGPPHFMAGMVTTFEVTADATSATVTTGTTP